MNLFDFGHTLLTGEWKIHRDAVRETAKFNALVREKREMMVKNHVARMGLYAGAEPGINRKYPNILSTPEDYKQAYERIVLIRAARQMEEDYGFFDGLLDDFEQYVIGDALAYLPNTGNDDADAKIRDFLEWKFDEADFTGQHDLTKLMQLAVRTMKRDGECGYIPVDTGDSIKLRGYSGDCIGNPMIGANIGPNNYNGIVTDDSGTVVRFDLYKRVPKLNAYFPDVSVSANDFWHYADPFRMQQYHGVSVFKNQIRDGFDIDQILEFTKLNIKWRASQLPTVHTETGRPRGAGIGYFNWGQNGGNGGATGPTRGAGGPPEAMQLNVEGVTTTFMKLDEQVMEYPNDFPNAQLGVSLEEFRRQCCKGAKIPYEFAYRADNGGVVQRFWADKAMGTFQKDKHLVRRVILNRYKNRVIQKGIDTGELDLDSFGNLNTDIARFKGMWNMGKAISVDYGKENETDIKLIEAGLMSPQDKVASEGRNLADVTKEIESYTTGLFKAAERVAKKVLQPVEAILPFFVKKYPNAPKGEPTAVGGPGAAASAAPSAPATPPEPAPEIKAFAERLEKLQLRADNAPTPAQPATAAEVARELFKLVQAQTPPSISITNNPPAVNVAPPTVNVAAPDVTVNVEKPDPAVVNVNVPAPAAQPAPVVNVNVPVPVVNVNVPAPVAKPTSVTVTRDSSGKIDGGKIT